MTPRFAYTLAAACLAIIPAQAQAPDLSAIDTQLRAQETKDSQLMWWLHEVTDVYGPRLTGSPGLKAAEDFAVSQMQKWGFKNVHLEAWNFNHPGWQNYDLEANVTAPFQQPLNVRAVSWTPGRTAWCRVRCWSSNHLNPRPAVSADAVVAVAEALAAPAEHDARAVGRDPEPRYLASAHARTHAQRE